MCALLVDDQEAGPTCGVRGLIDRHPLAFGALDCEVCSYKGTVATNAPSFGECFLVVGSAVGSERFARTLSSCFI